VSFYDTLFSGEKLGKEQKTAGITTGEVKENWNKEYPGMVKVEFFLGEQGKTLTGWLRVVQSYAGNGYGAYWLPEVGDEVVLGFNQGDANRPYVLGSLWNNVDKLPPNTATEKNHVKRVKTKGGHEIVFEEEKGKERLEIHTPKNLKLTMNDEKQTITIQDEAGDNLLQIDSKNNKIIVTAKDSFKLEAGGKSSLEMDAGQATLKADNITIEAGQGLQLKGQNFTGEGNMVSLKGQSSFKVESSASLELKGALTKIN